MSTTPVTVWRKNNAPLNIRIICEYESQTKQYRVTATQGAIKFSQSFASIFPYAGAMEFFDYQESLRLANELFGKIEYLQRERK